MSGWLVFAIALGAALVVVVFLEILARFGADPRTLI